MLSPMQVLADNGGFVLAEDGARLLFFQRRILPTWLVFVPGLLTVITVGNAVVQLVLGNVAVGAVLLAVGVACGFGTRAALGSRRRAKAAPLVAGDAVVVIDTDARVLLDGDGVVLAPLDAVRIERAMQVTSSSRALRVAWPGEAVVVYRGDALSLTGSIDAPVTELRSRGLTVA